MIKEKKQILRCGIKSKLIGYSDKSNSDRIIVNNLRSFIFPLFIGKSVGIFYPIKSEVNILSAAKELSCNHLFLPVCKNLHEIEFYPWKIGEELYKSRFFKYVYEPDTRNLSPDIPNFIIIPVLACDLRGIRLGNGFGFYDRYLEKYSNKIISIGVCYDFQVLDEVPYENHDQKLDIIVTDKQIINNSLLHLKLNSNMNRNI